MILTGCEIERCIEAGEIVIKPFDPAQLNPNSYNYKLGDSYIEFDERVVLDSHAVAARQPCPIPLDGLVLKPSSFYLCNTLEVIGSDKYVTSLIGKSSMGRLGLYLQISANLGHQGEVHRWTLELRCIQPLRIYPRMIIGQVTFWSVAGNALPSRGYYAQFDEPTLSRGSL